MYSEIVDGLTWNYKACGREVVVLEISKTKKNAIAIPSMLGGHPVTSIGKQAFRFCGSLTSVTIPDSVTDIGHWAFRGCAKLDSATKKWLKARWPKCL